MSENTYPECDQFTEHRRKLCRGERADVPVDGPNSVNAYRRLWGLPPLGVSPDEWDVTKPSRGLGDVVAKFTHATGIDRVVKAVTNATGTGCGCNKRQKAFNKAVPFTSQVQTSRRE